MNCEKCNAQSAVVFYKQTINGVTSSYNLCKNCAATTGMENSTSENFNDLLKSFMLIKSHSSYINQAIECDFCHYTFDMIFATGKIGCARCYATFKHQLNDSIRRIHGDSEYSDATPIFQENASPISQIDDLRTRLKSAVNTEDYEHAAKLRDQIKILEGDIENVVQI